MDTPKCNLNSPWPRRPFDPARLPFFYGWAVVAFATIGIISSTPGQTFGTGVFRDALITVLGLTNKQITLAYMFGTVTSSFLLPRVGSLVDRFGTRVTIVVAALGLGASLCLFSYADMIPTLVSSTWAILAATAFLYLLIRFFGQGCLTMISRVAIAKWFNHRRGLATGMASVVTTFAFNASPAYLNLLVLGLGWQHSYLVLALVCGLGMAVVGLIFYRDNPEQCGLPMDGRVDPDHLSRARSRISPIVHQFTRREALKTTAFWTYAIPLAWQAMIMTIVAFLITSIGEEAGLSRNEAYAPFKWFGLIGAVTVAFTGWLSDRTRLKWLLLVMAANQVLTGVGLFLLASPWGRTILIVGYGISGGLFGLLLTVSWPRYFGRSHLGAITSVVTSIVVFASAVGPYLYEMLCGLFGSYRLVSILVVVLPLAFLVPAAIVRNPQTRLTRHPRDQQSSI